MLASTNTGRTPCGLMHYHRSPRSQANIILNKVRRSLYRSRRIDSTHAIYITPLTISNTWKTRGVAILEDNLISILREIDDATGTRYCKQRRLANTFV